MVRAIVILVGLALAASMPVMAVQNVKLSWSPSTNSNVVGYEIYYGTASQVYTSTVTVGNVTNATIPNLIEGTTYYFSATSYDSNNNQSLFSNETSYSVPIPAVQPANPPPTLNAISDLTLDINAPSRTIALSGISAGITNAHPNIKVTVASSNTGLIKPTISYTSPQTTGKLTFTPVANATGSATITVTVNNGTTTNNLISQSFLVMVTNAPPTIASLTGSNMVIHCDGPQQTVNLTGITSGATNEHQTLKVTVLSSNPGLIKPSITYSSPQTTGKLTFQPTSHLTGIALLTVTVNDGNLPAQTSFTVQVTNAMPTIDSLAGNNLIVHCDASQQTVNFTGISSGATNENQHLTVTTTSSNPTLLKPSVTYSSPQTTGHLTFTPTANLAGTATVTVYVGDGNLTNQTSFTVQVTNAMPTIDSLAGNNLIVHCDASQQTVDFSGISSGSTNENQHLTVIASSSNPTLLKPSVTYSSPQATGKLTFQPTAHLTGTAHITVYVGDGNLTNQTSFTVQVTNAAPTINEIDELALPENAPSQTVNMTGISSGATNENQTLKVTAVSSNPKLIQPTVSYSSPGTTGKLTFKPAANTNGLALITVSVNDGNLTTQTSFIVTVGASSPSSSSTSQANPPVLTALGIVNGHFEIQIAGDPGSQIVVQATSDLINWNPLQVITIPVDASSILFIDSNTPDSTPQFYRAAVLGSH